LLKKIIVHLGKIRVLSTMGAYQISGTIVNALFWIFLAAYLPKEEYGELSYLFATAALGSSIALLGLDRVNVVFSAKGENISSSVYQLAIFSSLVISTIFYLLFSNIFISILIFTMALFSIYLSRLNGEKKFVKVTKFNFISKILTVCFALILYQFFGIGGMLLGMIIATSFFIKDIYMILKNTKPHLSLLKPKLNFILFNYASVLTGTGIFFVDKIIIGLSFGFVVLGDYHYALQYFSILAFIIPILHIYLLPLESEGISKRKFKIYIVILTIILSIILIVITPIIVETFFPKFDGIILPIRITSIGIIPFVISSIYEISFIANNQSKFSLIANFIQAGLYLPSLILLGNEFGILGFSLAFLFSHLVRMVFNVIVHNKIKLNSV
jgi:O-antigen/teichoic acid export membrane protein